MKKLYVFSILLVLLAAFACSSKKAVQKEHLTDDILEQNVRLTVRSTTLPESRATLKIASHDNGVSFLYRNIQNQTVYG